jgi:hypothetical protein
MADTLVVPHTCPCDPNNDCVVSLGLPELSGVLQTSVITNCCFTDHVRVKIACLIPGGNCCMSSKHPMKHNGALDIEVVNRVPGRTRNPSICPCLEALIGPFFTRPAYMSALKLIPRCIDFITCDQSFLGVLEIQHYFESRHVKGAQFCGRTRPPHVNVRVRDTSWT